MGMLVLSVAILSSSGCTDTAAIIRQATYPPDFKYLSEQELQSNMDKLANQLQLLDMALLGSSSAESPGQQQEVLVILGDMERISRNLRAGPAGSNHPFLEDHMSDFVISVGQARNAASLATPRYYLAGRLAGGCVNCHKINR